MVFFKNVDEARAWLKPPGVATLLMNFVPYETVVEQAQVSTARNTIYKLHQEFDDSNCLRS